jgi:hypothetical protein
MKHDHTLFRGTDMESFRLLCHQWPSVKHRPGVWQEGKKRARSSMLLEEQECKIFARFGLVSYLVATMK